MAFRRGFLLVHGKKLPEVSEVTLAPGDRHIKICNFYLTLKLIKYEKDTLSKSVVPARVVGAGVRAGHMWWSVWWLYINKRLGKSKLKLNLHNVLHVGRYVECFLRAIDCIIQPRVNYGEGHFSGHALPLSYL